MNNFEIVGNKTRQDIFGFYEVGKLKFYSQIEALEVSKRFNLPIKWNFNDEAFSSYNWKIEPEETISELYKKRCEQLREKYDYLVLFYSGGADSDNILNHFVSNKIPLDEVVSLIDYEATQNKLSSWSAEIFEVAIPRIKKIQEDGYNIKHTLIDMTNMILKKYESLDLDLIYEQNSCWTPYIAIKDDMKMSQEHWRKMIFSGKKVAFIHGIDKPRVSLDKNEFNFSFGCFGITASIPPSIQRKNNPWEFDELFYWSPDFPKIPIKQSHIIKNFVKENGTEGFKKQNKFYGNPGQSIRKLTPHDSFTLEKDGKFLFDNTQLNVLLYPYWYKIPYQYRGQGSIFFDKENWFIEKMNSEIYSNNWKTILKKVLDLTETNYRKQNYFNNTLYASKLYNLGN